MKDGYHIAWIGFFLVVMGLALKQLDKQSKWKENRIATLQHQADSLRQVIRNQEQYQVALESKTTELIREVDSLSGEVYRLLDDIDNKLK